MRPVLMIIMLGILSACTTLGPNDYGFPDKRDAITCNAQAHSYATQYGGFAYHTYNKVYDNCMRSLGHTKLEAFKANPTPTPAPQSNCHWDTDTKMSCD